MEGKMISFKKTGLIFISILLTPYLCYAVEDQSAPPPTDDGQGGTSEAVESNADDNTNISPIWANYYGIYYGSSLSDPSSYQATADGARDPNRPVLIKHFVTAGYDFSPEVSIAATGYWVYIPMGGQQMITQDPSARISFNRIVHTDNFNWYGDLRAVFPVTSASRDADLLAAGETFHFVSYSFPDSRWMAGLYAKVRYNYFGKFGSGNDFDVYFAPMANYQISPKLTLTMLYEMGANHYFGQDAYELNNDGTDFQPGIAWSITPSVTFNPYLNLYTGDQVSWKTTSIGATLSWLFL
jgi:hypothetical protein